jgi:hypothetical protein
MSFSLISKLNNLYHIFGTCRREANQQNAYNFILIRLINTSFTTGPHINKTSVQENKNMDLVHLFTLAVVKLVISTYINDSNT